MRIHPPVSLINASVCTTSMPAIIRPSAQRVKWRRSVKLRRSLHTLDRLLGLERMYGNAGFQHVDQCVDATAPTAKGGIRSVVREIAKKLAPDRSSRLKHEGTSLLWSCVVVPHAGISLALDSRRARRFNRPLFDKLDALDCTPPPPMRPGRLYPARTRL